MSNLEALTEITDDELNIEDNDDNVVLDGFNEDIDDVDIVDVETDDDDDDDDNENDINNGSDDENASVILDDNNTFKDNVILEEDEEEDDDDDDDDNDEKYLQKFDNNVRTQFIESYHPEVLTHNYDEVKNLAKITRDKNGVIIDKLHKTIPFLTKYEKARIIGQRANQINAGAKPLIQSSPGVIDSYLIASKELELKKIPFIIKRPIPNGGFEYWNLSDLEVLD